jgi:hypothetical protein
MIVRNLHDWRFSIPSRSARTEKRGAALIFAVIGVFGAAAAVSVLVSTSLTSDRNANLEVDKVRAQYLAEGAVEAAKAAAATAVANWQAVPASGTAQFGTCSAPYTLAPTGFNTVSTDVTGVQTIVTGYEIEGRGTVNGVTQSSDRIVNLEATPIFQFTVFYDNDLEIQPGPNMTLTGRVHSNGNLHIGANNTSTLTVNTNYLHAVGNIYRNRKDNPSLSQGTVNIRNWVTNPWSAAEPVSYYSMKSKSQMTSAGVSTTSGYDSNFTAGYDLNGNGSYSDLGDYMPFLSGSQSYWGPPAGYSAACTSSTVQTGEHGLAEAIVPQIGSTAMYEPTTGGTHVWNAALGEYVATTPGTGTHSQGYFHDQAGLSIIEKADGTWKAYDASGANITASLTGAITTKNIYNAFQAGGTASKVKVLQLDMAQLAASGKFPANGLIYTSNYGLGTGLASGGIKLVNGSSLPAKMTLVSNGPAYIQGNFNTTAKKGAAVIADAINLLSNSWNDSKAKGSLPAASNTTYNVAMIAGINETKVGKYNGGLENLPRFHENWSGKICTVSGSLVNLWYSQYATGDWSIGGDFYNAPTRVWSYDTAFNTVANLPPFTPMVVEAADVVSW